MARQRRRRHAEQLLLGLIRIGDEAAIDDVGGTGNLGQRRGDESAGAGFRGGDTQAARAAQIEHAPCGAAQLRRRSCGAPRQPDRRRRHRDDALAAAGEAELFAGGRLDRRRAPRQCRRSRRCARAWRRGAARRAAPRTRWSRRDARSCRGARARARRRRRESDPTTAPFHCGSLGGKCAPMSPSASAPRMASTSACSATSASECPVTPRECGMRTPPSMT